MSNKLLSIKNLELSFKMYEGTLNVLKKINLELEKGEKLAKKTHLIKHVKHYLRSQ
jgi:ABC-type microcin C transport system duplicated ATPase subunit YejF